MYKIELLLNHVCVLGTRYLEAYEVIILLYYEGVMTHKKIESKHMTETET